MLNYYVHTTYYIYPIILEIPTYPKIGHPLWTFPTLDQPNLFHISPSHFPFPHGGKQIYRSMALLFTNQKKGFHIDWVNDV